MLNRSIQYNPFVFSFSFQRSMEKLERLDVDSVIAARLFEI